VRVILLVAKEQVLPVVSPGVPQFMTENRLSRRALRSEVGSRKVDVSAKRGCAGLGESSDFHRATTRVDLDATERRPDDRFEKLTSGG
jgi:hypothetical protein